MAAESASLGLLATGPPHHPVARVRTGRFTMMEHTTGVMRSHGPSARGRGPKSSPLTLQPSIRHPDLRREGLRQVPVALATDRCQDRLALARSQSQQILHLGARPAPLLPVAHPDATANPVVDLRKRSVAVRDATVGMPSSRSPRPPGLGMLLRLTGDG